MLKLKRLRIERFRSLSKGTELLFSDGINIVLGQNGTGKTTLLELISMVLRSDFSGLEKEDFAIEYELAAPGTENIIVVVGNARAPKEERRQPSIGDTFRPSAEVFVSAGRRRLLEYSAERGLSTGDKTPLGPAGISSPVDPGFLIAFAAELPAFPAEFLVQAVHRFDESLGLFGRITSPGCPIGKIFIEGSTWFFDPLAPPLVPESLLQRLRDCYKKQRPDYSFKHDEFSLLATLKDMMGFSSCDLRVDVTEPPGGTSVQLDNIAFRFRWEDGTSITHERLSYGQKRLLTFFYYLECNPHIVVADELVNGLHHRWITSAIEAIGQRQAFLTSQNPLLLDYVPITSADEVRRSFVLCLAEPRAGRPGWVWENMTEDDAAELFRAYGVGIEHVSEILQSRGLW